MFAVWQPMLPTDWVAPASSVLRRLSDLRVQQYWDPHHLLAKQMQRDARAPQPVPDCCVRSDVLWDLAALYAPGSDWEDQIPPATVFNGPVVDVTDVVEKALVSNRAMRWGSGMSIVFDSRSTWADDRRMIRRLCATIAIALMLATNLAALDCVGWQASPKDRMACCAKAKHGCPDQMAADQCCAAGELVQQAGLISPVIAPPAPVVALSPLPLVVLPSSIAALHRTLSDYPQSPPHLRRTVLLIWSRSERQLTQLVAVYGGIYASWAN